MPEEKGKREKEQEQKEFHEAYDWYRDSVKDGYIFIMTTEEIDFCKVGDEKIPKEKLFEKGIKLHHSEGYQSGEWVLLDFNGLVVHLFIKDKRDFYDLDRVWADAMEI